MAASSDAPTALAGVTVLDLTRILAGPTCTQLLGDLGADVIKVENPSSGGDDTRRWGPPFAAAERGESDLSAYFMSSNRNKRSVAIDLRTAEGQAQVRSLASRADVMVENFKPGGLARYGLDHESMCAAYPGLVYCSISGYGQTGPNRHKPGYDLMAQGYGGIMSLTGEPNGRPMKVGVGIADIMCGMYAAVGILAALRHRDATGEGQHIDLSLVDTQMAWLINEGVNYLTSGDLPLRRGNAHPNIVPYDVFEVRDGHVVIAVGNDAQFRRFCGYLGLALADDLRFATNPARVANREALMAEIGPALRSRLVDDVVAGLEALGIPVGPINDVAAALGSDQASARDVTIRMPNPASAADDLSLLGNPLKLSRTPVSYRRPPPRMGQHTSEVLDGDDSN